MVYLVNKIIFIDFFTLFFGHFNTFQSFAFFEGRLEKVSFLDQSECVDVV